MEAPKTYNPIAVEQKWYKHWMDMNYFHSVPDHREPYTIVIPPPNVTGVLHMGHMLNNTIQDILVRRARMLGKNACWVPGTDHASIATEAKVVNKLKAEGIQKKDLSREDFLKHAFEWKEKHGGIILDQLKKLGASCDWERTHFTMDQDYSDSVLHVFVDLFQKGRIYRGVRMVNWDPEALTAVSDEEVIYKEVQSKLYFVKYELLGHENEFLVVATTRPETILGDTAICVNPEDDRYHKFIGKEVVVPLTQRRIPVISDEYVDPTFGTGCLKVTPAHDINDYELGKKHNLDSIDLFNENGTLNSNGLHYEGVDRFEVRKRISLELQECGALIKADDYVNKVGLSERTQAVIEPKLSMQWFLSMSDLAQPALDHVMNEDIKFYPDKFKNTYRHWMENIKDWCISRQLWWGHQIPAWYYGRGVNDFVVALTSDEALVLAKEKTGRPLEITDLHQDEDVLDTWFSSWLWPISVFKGLTEPNNEEINYYYPTNDLVTGPDIIFFWVARMIMAGYQYKDQKPFSNVYYTGIVRDKMGRKMSKTLGNSPDPIELIDQYGADGVRMGVLISAPAGNDLPFDVAQCEQGRNFANKIWNAYRLVSGWEEQELDQPTHSQMACAWFDSRLNQTLDEVNGNFDKFRISDALMATYKMVWDDFCAVYLEIIKPEYEKPIDHLTRSKTIAYFEQLIKMLHPFMPFITEELWHLLNVRSSGDDLILSKWPTAGPVDLSLLSAFDHALSIVLGIRNHRKAQAIPNKIKLTLAVLDETRDSLESVVIKMGNIGEWNVVTESPLNASSFLVGAKEYYIPLGEEADLGKEREKLEEELKYLIGFLKSVEGKLSNANFVKGAPAAVVEMERKKTQDAQLKINLIQGRLKSFS